MRYTSLARNINPVLREHLFKKEVLEECTSSAKERKSILMDYFDYLAEQFHLPSPMELTGQDIELTTPKNIERYQSFLRDKMHNKEATIYIKLSYIRLFYEDFIASGISGRPMDNPFSVKKQRRHKKEQPEIKSRYFYLDYLRHLGGTYEIRDKLMVSLILTMGLTDTEICRLNLADIIADGEDLWLRMTGRAMRIDPNLFSSENPVEIIPPLIPVNGPTAEWLKTWLTMRPETKPDVYGSPLFLSKYRKRLKENGVIFILKNHAEKQNLDSKDFLPALLRRFAIQNYLDAGGNDGGLRDFFGIKLFTASEESGNIEAYLHHAFISEMG